MATTLPVERIDIIEGPRLDPLLDGLKGAVKRDGILHEIFVWFDEVVYFAQGGKEIAELGRTISPKIVGIRYLGNKASHATRHDFVIAAQLGGMTFEGHYNVLTRKGSLIAIK